MEKLKKRAEILSFERKFQISDGALWQANEKQESPANEPLRVTGKSVRGTFSSSSIDQAKSGSANPQNTEVATLDLGYDSVVCTWTCKVMPFDGKPSACSNIDYQERVQEIVRGYKKEQGMEKLANRYAANIANARWLWRNRMGAERVDVSVSYGSKGSETTLSFKKMESTPLTNFDFRATDLRVLSQKIEEALLDVKPHLLSVRATAVIGEMQEVFPSQEMLLDKTQGKVLYRLNEVTNQAGLHSQKIGNAIRTIDTWYDEETKFPIAVEPYGSVTTLGRAFRQPKDKIDFYTLFDDWVLKGEKPAVEQQHYVIAVLLRGGVFGEGSKEKT
jgi:CRISPR-associated protein Csy3